MEKEIRNAHACGQNSFHNGLTIDDNPHTVGTEEYDAWAEGWVEQEELDRLEDDTDWDDIYRAAASWDSSPKRYRQWL